MEFSQNAWPQKTALRNSSSLFFLPKAGAPKVRPRATFCLWETSLLSPGFRAPKLCLPVWGKRVSQDLASLPQWSRPGSQPLHKYFIPLFFPWESREFSPIPTSQGACPDTPERPSCFRISFDLFPSAWRNCYGSERIHWAGDSL